MAALDLVPVYLSDRKELVTRLATTVERAFDLSVRIKQPWFEPEIAHDAVRGQYSSTILLSRLLESTSSRVLGVTGIDLFAPVLTYVFGEAQLDGRAAVVSIHRLRPEAYGLAPDDALLFARLEKEAVHELGHTYGLLHCMDPECVMHSSRVPEEIDIKTAAFCMDCLGVVRGRVPADT